MNAAGGVKTTRSDGYNVHTFTTSGTLQVGADSDFTNGDIFGDGSNIFTLDIATGTLGDNSKEGGFTLRGYENRGTSKRWCSTQRDGSSILTAMYLQVGKVGVDL